MFWKKRPFTETHVIRGGKWVPILDADVRFIGATNTWVKARKNWLGKYSKIPRVPPGKYEIYWGSVMSGLNVLAPNEDKFFNFEPGASLSAFSEFTKFQEARERYRAMGFAFKRGFFLWGPPGCGKTTLINRMADHIVERGGVVVYARRHFSEEIDIISKINVGHDFPVLVVMEDFESLVQGPASEKQVLAFLDGELAVDNMVFLATSNYPEQTNKRIFDRPSRFDTVLYIPPPDANFRRNYLKSKLGDDPRVEDMVKGSKGYSIAHLKELLISVYCLEFPLEQALEKLDSMRKAVPDSENAPGKKESSFGFRWDPDEEDFDD